MIIVREHVLDRAGVKDFPSPVPSASAATECTCRRPATYDSLNTGAYRSSSDDILSLPLAALLDIDPRMKRWALCPFSS